MIKCFQNICFECVDALKGLCHPFEDVYLGIKKCGQNETE